MRKTEIVATYGPKLSTRPVRAQMIEAGVDVLRINASHMKFLDFPFFEAIIRETREIATIYGRRLKVMIDTPGHKFRLGEFSAREFRTEEELTLTAEASPLNGEIPFPCLDYLCSLRPEHEILLGDGSFRLRVLKAATAESSTVTCLVTLGGMLGKRKGVFARGLDVSSLNLSPLTDEDREALRFAIRVKAEQVVLSFGTSAAQMRSFTDFYRGLGGVGEALFKYELKEAGADLQAIVAASDAGFVGQGDLSQSVPSEEVPAEAKKVVDAFRAAGKSCIVGTQLLTSMRELPHPTNGERAGIYYCVGIGASGLMLSDETADGNYPVEAVRSLDKLICAAEAMYV